MKSNELCLDELNKEANTKNKKNFYQLTNRCFPVYTINRLYSCKMHALYYLSQTGEKPTAMQAFSSQLKWKEARTFKDKVATIWSHLKLIFVYLLLFER